MRTEAAAWLAGIIEGEGHLGTHTSRGHRYPRVSVGMIDQDIIERLQGLVGTGRVNGPYRNTLSTSDYWIWRVAVTKDVIDLLRVVRPWLGKRKGKKADEMLEEFG